MLSIHLLGEPRFLLGEQPLADSAGARARELLAYLAVFADQAHRRDRLMEAIWPDKDLERASASLRRALFLLRQALDTVADDVLEVSDASIRLIRDRVDCDLWQLETILHDTLPSPAVTPAAVAGIYGGDLMGTAAPDWAYLRREQLRREVIAVISAGAVTALDLGDHDQVVELAGLWVRIEPLDERAHLVLMQHYARIGDQAGVIRQHELCRSLYARSRRGVPVGLEDAFSALCEQASERSLSIFQASRSVPDSLEPNAAPTVGSEASAAVAAPALGALNGVGAPRTGPRFHPDWAIRAAAVIAMAVITGLAAAAWQRADLQNRNVSEIIHEFQFATAMERLPVDSGNPLAVDAWFKGNIPYPVDVTPGALAAFALQGAGACDLDGHVAATAVYRAADHSAVALFRLDAGTFSLPHGSALTKGPDPIWRLQHGGHTILFWNHGGLTYAVVGAMTPDALLPIAMQLVNG